jgi:hypothetical protein
MGVQLAVICLPRDVFFAAAAAIYLKQLLAMPQGSIAMVNDRRFWKFEIA